MENQEKNLHYTFFGKSTPLLLSLFFNQLLLSTKHLNPGCYSVQIGQETLGKSKILLIHLFS